MLINRLAIWQRWRDGTQVVPLPDSDTLINDALRIQ